MGTTADYTELIFRLLAALVAGAVIGYERSYHGRPAGFRTHALVCTASSILMLVTVYENHWVRTAVDAIRLDPTRMAQGIMTGIGFLGAGVIIKEGLAVRGLTTAASIWITAAIGILAGIGFFFPMTLAVLLTLGILSLFRWIEARMPTQNYFHFTVRFKKGAGLNEAQLRELVEHCGFSMANFSYSLEHGIHSHSMMLRSIERSGAVRLAEVLERNETVLAFRISPSGN